MSSPIERHSLGPMRPPDCDTKEGSSPLDGSRFVQSGVRKLPGRRVVSLDSGGLPPPMPAAGYQTLGGGKHRAHSAESVDSKGFLPPSVMVPLNFDKVQDDIAHPLSSLRSCSEFGMHGVGATEASQQSAPKKRSLWKRTVGWFKGKKRPKVVEDSAVMSLSERSKLAQMGEDYRAQRMASTATRHRLWSTQPAPRFSVDSMHSGGGGYLSGVEGRRESTSYTSAGRASAGNKERHSASFVGEVKSTFWGTLGFDTPEPESCKDIEMKTFRIAGAWVLPIEGGFSPITRTSSARSLSSRDSLPSRPSFYGGSARPATTAIVDISVFDIVFSDLWHVLYVSESFKAFAEYSLLCFDYLRDLSLRFGEEGFLDAMRIQPVSTGNYFRGMLMAGLVSMLFNGSALLSMHSGYEDETKVEEYSSVMGIFFYGWLYLVTVLNLIQLPLRLCIHIRLLQIPQATVHEAGDILRDLSGTDAWICNRLLNWLLDVMSMLGLLVAEVYFYVFMLPACSSGGGATSCSQSNALGTVVVNIAATALLTLIVRSAIVLMFCASAVDPQTLSEARKRGLSRYDVDKLPAFLYTDIEEVNNTTCSICLCAFDRGEMLISLPCDNRHSFHANCIRDWLIRQNACPLCQKLV